MLKCVEFESKINIMNLEQKSTVVCPECGIELEIFENNLVGLLLGHSEEGNR